MKKNQKMNAKRTLVSFLAIATLLFLVATVSAAGEYSIDKVEVNDVEFPTIDPVLPVTAGETVKIEVWFSADFGTTEEDGEDFYDVDVIIEAEIDAGEKVSIESEPMVVESGDSRKVTLTLKVPCELEDEVSKLIDLTIEIDGEKYKTTEIYSLRVQRPSYNADVKSIIVSSSVEAGQISPVDIVLQNTGYNDLENVYVTVRIPELSIERTSYFGDLVAVDDEDDENTVSGRIYLEVPYNVASGIYTLEVEVANEDFSNPVVEKQIAVQNGFPEVAVKSGDNLLVLNPTNHLKVYKVVYPSEEVTVVVQAGSSKLVPIVAEGEYNFDVFVFAGNELAGTVNFSGTSDSQELASPVVVLTVILAIIFLVLLVVMIVLITKKPEKTEEFGESYY